MPPKTLFLTQLSIFLIISASAQNSREEKKEDHDISGFSEKNISIPPPADIRALKNIVGIVVVDARPDTAAIGFMQKSFRSRTFIKLNNGVRNEAQQFIGNYLRLSNDTSQSTLIMVLKKLWLTDELDSKNRDFKDTLAKWKSGVIAKVEFYLKKNDEYFPLYRYDTILTKTLTVAEYGPEFIEWALTSSVGKLIKMDSTEIITSARKLNWGDIDNYNRQKYSIPILRDSVLNRGVYVTFDEFKNNSPSQKNFEIRKDKLNDILYEELPDGKEVAERNIWGYSDGKYIFIKSAENYFKLQRRQNAFYIYGVKNVDRIGPEGKPLLNTAAPNANNGYYVPGFVGGIGGVAMYDQFRKPKFKVVLKPYQLDWDSGKLY